MAKKSSILTNNKRLELCKRYEERRRVLKEKSLDVSLSYKERFQYQSALDALPRNSSYTRYRNRCVITGRPRGYYRHFGVSRIILREMALSGITPGVIKASW